MFTHFFYFDIDTVRAYIERHCTAADLSEHQRHEFAEVCCIRKSIIRVKGQFHIESFNLFLPIMHLWVFMHVYF